MKIHSKHIITFQVITKKISEEEEEVIQYRDNKSRRIEDQIRGVNASRKKLIMIIQNIKERKKQNSHLFGQIDWYCCSSLVLDHLCLVYYSKKRK